MIDLRRLRVLRAVAHYGTVTAAAKALHFTPSAASQQIRQLGRELGVVLLEPHGRRVRLSPAALGLLAHADAIQARWELAESELRGADGRPCGLLRVCGFPVAVSRLLAPLVVELGERHPGLTVRIRETELQESLDLLFEGEADLAVIESTPGNPPLDDSRFDQRPLLDDPFDLVVPEAHPFAGRERVGLAEAASESWILTTSGCTCREHTLAACSAAGFTPSVAHDVLEWNAVANLIAHGLGIAFVPRLAHLPPHLPIARVSCTSHPTRKLLTCTRGGGEEHPAIAAALDALRRAAPTTVT